MVYLQASFLCILLRFVVFLHKKNEYNKTLATVFNMSVRVGLNSSTVNVFLLFFSIDSNQCKNWCNLSYNQIFNTQHNRV